MSPRKRTSFAIAVFVAISLAVILLLNSRVPPGATAADGRRIRIEKVTFGTQHSFTMGKLWVRVLKPALGTPWAARHGCVEMRFTNAQSGLMVWTKWSGVSATNPLSLEATILDEHGTESELVLSRWNQSDGSAHTNRFDSISYVGWIFRNYPRRSASLSLRIYDRDQQHRKSQAVEIPFRNPAPKHYPRWMGERFPVSRTNEGTVFTLREVTGTAATWNARFEVTTNGSPDHSWQVGSIQAHDGTGNSFMTRSNVLSAGSGDPRFQLHGSLWPGENAWRFSVEFCRETDSGTNEVWMTPEMAILPAGISGASITNSSLNGHTVVVIGVFAARHIAPRPAREMPANASVRLRLEPTDNISGRLKLLAAHDDAGREIRHEPGPGISAEHYNYNLWLPAGAKSVRFTFAVRESTMIDFDVAAESLLPKSKTAP
jgi:hypothetical protein